jgi:hypothetical protein
MPFIKQVSLSGFRSYKDQLDIELDIEPFEPTRRWLEGGCVI